MCALRGDSGETAGTGGGPGMGMRGKQSHDLSSSKRRPPSGDGKATEDTLQTATTRPAAGVYKDRCAVFNGSVVLVFIKIPVPCLMAAWCWC